MKIFFVGDACSGKTTILRRLKEEGYPVLLEEGW
jgi:GTPase SAR1 family protein